MKSIYKLKSAKNPGKSVDIYWVLEKADIPSDLKFVADEKDNRHYFLTVTRKMTVNTLVKKLKWVSDRMSIIKDGSSALFYVMQYLTEKKPSIWLNFIGKWLMPQISKIRKITIIASQFLRKL